MRQSIFYKSVFFSFFGHLIVFLLFSLSFGKVVLDLSKTNVSFLGHMPIQNKTSTFPVKNSILDDLQDKSLFSIPVNRIKDKQEFSCQKPLSPLYFYSKKAPYSINLINTEYRPRIRKPTLIFHPSFPYSLNLYLKDTQTAHVELLFKVSSENNILIKRRISSGNLELDLLSERYINHYLSLQQANITSDNWQAVKIDLSAQE